MYFKLFNCIYRFICTANESLSYLLSRLAILKRSKVYFSAQDPPAEVDPHGQVPVAAVRVEPITTKCELHQGHMRRIHALQGDPRRAHIPARLCDQVLQGL